MIRHTLRPGGRPRRGRLLALLAVPVLAVSILSPAPGPEPATASPAVTSANPGSDPAGVDFASLPGGAKPTAVTLITGDTVLWSDTGDGQPRLEIEQAPREVPVEFDQYGSSEDFYVIPSDMIDQVVAGTVDRELFNIPSLIRQGLDDESTGGELPVIVTFDTERSPQQLERDANALPAAGDALAVEGIQGAGVKVDREKAARFRDAVLVKPGKGNGESSQSDSLDGAVDKIMLDRMLEIDLAESVPQIGAPEAWDAGYTGEGVTVAVLDTGIDAGHPDLAGQVVAAENFVGGGAPVDDNGHGTHVASTIAGTGAASDGARKGVAPDADLISGKVCNANGQCPDSAIMAAMEWAAERADVVNMSLGDPGSDGTDVLSQLLNELSAATGTLFVTSAGNSGGRQLVGSPGAADAALSVGAVDKADQLAWFSSRGPRLGDHAVKPEITAPGVGIIAARAEGSEAAPPVDDVYMSLNGTSMASPHVAGAAALLAQAQPDLGGTELKDALVSTATDIDRLWWEVGVGRVDVPAAMDSPVYAQGTVNLGVVTDLAEKDLTYTNHGDADVTLTLDATVTKDNGEALDVVSLSAETLTVPAGGQASVTVAVDITGVPGAGESRFSGGVVTATGDGVSLRTGIGFGPPPPPMHTLTIEVLDSHGNRIGTDRAPDQFVTITQDTRDADNPIGNAFYSLETADGVTTEEVPTGKYTIMPEDVVENDPATGEALRRSVVIESEVLIESDTTITLDARDATVLVEQPEVPHEVDVRNKEVALYRVSESGAFLARLNLGVNSGPLYVTPTPPAELGFLGLGVYWVLAEPQPVHPLPRSAGCVFPVPLIHRCYSRTPAYIYNLPFVYENGIPDDLKETVTRSDLVEVPTRYHTHYPDALIMRQFNVSGVLVGAGTAAESVVNFSGGNSSRVWIEPGAVTEYVLADDRIDWIRSVLEQAKSVAGSRESQQVEGSFDRFPAAEAGSARAEERWFEGPVRVGVTDRREDFLQGPLEKQPMFATASRGGRDGNQFIPGYQIMDNTRGHFMEPYSRLPSFASWRMWNLDTGAEIHGDEHNPAAGVPSFTLATNEATYRLKQIDQYPVDPPFGVGVSFRTGPATTTWEFTSRPSDAEVAPYLCPLRDDPFNPQEPWSFVCQIQPLIQLEYQLGLDIHNQAPAGRAHVFTINAGHHSKAIDRAKVTDLSVEASFDDGKTWTDARVIGKAKDSWDTGGFLPSAEPYQEYKVALKVPPLNRTNGFVTLRVKAEDANGGTVDQTVHRAYLLK